jgi:lipopolysaccharide heptosyltransferase II
MRIVCFHLNQVGDLAFSLPALKCIRDSYPEAHITSVVRPALAELLEASGLVHEVLRRPSGLNSAKLRLVRYLNAGNFDLAVVFSQSAECALLARLSRAKARVGFDDTSLGRLLTKRVPFVHPPSTANNLRLVEACGCRITRQDYVGLLKPVSSKVEEANELLASYGVGKSDKIVALSPGTSGRRRLKEWTDEGFATVARYVIDRGMRVVVLGTAPAHKIVKECPQIIDLGGKTALTEAVAILSRCETLVAVDSGILHLAAALGKRVIGLYGPSDPEVTGPQGTGHVVLTAGAECSPCGQEGCNNQRKCMTNIEPDWVVNAVDTLLKNQANCDL